MPYAETDNKSAFIKKLGRSTGFCFGKIMFLSSFFDEAPYLAIMKTGSLEQKFGYLFGTPPHPQPWFFGETKLLYIFL